MSPNNATSSAEAIAEIWTEGKTDWRLLKRAMQALAIDLPISFHESDKDMGDGKLLRTLQAFADRENAAPLVFIFDHDKRDIVAQVDSPDGTYKNWGNNVFSFSLPVPDHRPGYENISIEMLFTDEDIQRKDDQGRQLFLTSQFDEVGKHRDDPTVHCGRAGYLKGCTEPHKAKIVDSEVYNAQSRNIALTKSGFATYVGQGKSPFDTLNFQHFHAVFRIIENIVSVSIPRSNVYCPEWDTLVAEIDALESTKQARHIFTRIHNIFALALEIFSICTIRVYERDIVNEPDDKRKRVVPIRKIVSEAFRNPSLATLVQLAEKCYHLIDDEAPEALRVMKKCLEQTIVLRSLGQLWDDLEMLLPPEIDAARIINKPEIKRDLLRQFLPIIAGYTDRSQESLGQAFEAVDEIERIDIGGWKQALAQAIALMQPFFTNDAVFKRIVSRDPHADVYLSDVKTYHRGFVYKSSEKIQGPDEEYERRSSEILLASDVHIHVYPFLLIRDDALFYYRRTTPLGYEYSSLLSNRVHTEPTRIKFSQTLFGVGSRQDLFWTDVLPTKNPNNHITANIPAEGPAEFIGRKRVINQIKDEIIRLVNENGIVYGPGGIGKTALIIQLTKELYAEKNPDNVVFDNIVWVSAKNSLYDYIFDTIEEREPQVKSLDTILQAILRFFDFGNVEEYGFEDRKELVLELMEDYRILLILDNFESIPKPEQVKIIEFFGTEAKKRLRRKPQNFKVILTSRESVPTGFRQIELSGLDVGESKRLIKSLFKRYRTTRTELTDSQIDELIKATKGIPIVLKHCMARVYEYNESLSAVLRGLPSLSNRIVQFSYHEILQQVERSANQLALQILLLLEVVDMPLMVRQMSDILEADEHRVEGTIPLLAGFECIRRIIQDNQEKYVVNDEIRLLTKSLMLQHQDLARDIRRRYHQNFSFERQMDYTSEEEGVVEVFEGYLRNREFVDAENFIKKELKKRPTSVLLNIYYARYLMERRNDTDAAAKILEHLCEVSHNHPVVLRLLFACYAEASIPRFEAADDLVNQIRADLGDYLEQSLDFQFEIATFYVRWSVVLKLKRGIDPFEENSRQARYKELARKALGYLEPIESKLSREKIETDETKLHEVCYRMAQCYHNLWDYNAALMLVSRAIAAADQAKDLVAVDEYCRFRLSVQANENFYDRNPWIDRRRGRR